MGEAYGRLLLVAVVLTLLCFILLFFQICEHKGESSIRENAKGKEDTSEDTCCFTFPIAVPFTKVPLE